MGTLGVVDFDVVDPTNLQRQILHGTKDLGRSKLDSAADRLHDVNPHVEVVRHQARLSSENALDILADYDVVVDGTGQRCLRDARKAQRLRKRLPMGGSGLGLRHDGWTLLSLPLP